MNDSKRVFVDSVDLENKCAIVQCHKDALVPTKGTDEAACYDLYVDRRTVIPAHRGVLVPTGVAFDLIPHTHVEIYLRSSMCKRGLVSSVGIVDSDYQGEVKVQACNITNEDIVVERGQRIGQFRLVCHRSPEDEPFELRRVFYRQTDRGTKGWGSTGR